MGRMSYSPFSGRRPNPPRLELVEVAWRMRAPSGRILEDGIYESEFGYEKRMGYGENPLVSQYAMTSRTSARMRSDSTTTPRRTRSLQISRTVTHDRYDRQPHAHL